MATKRKKEYKLYILYKGHKRYTYERSYPMRSLCELRGQQLKRDIYLRNVIVAYKVV